MKIKMLAAGFAATMLTACSQSEDPAATKDKLLLTYQTLLGIDLDVTGSELPVRGFNQGSGYSTLYLGEQGKDPYSFEVSTLKDDKTKCQIYVKVDSNDTMGPFGRYTIDLAKVYLGKPNAAVNDYGWAFGQVSYELGAIQADGGKIPLKKLGAKLGHTSGDANSQKTLWEGRLATLQKYCPGR